MTDLVDQMFPPIHRKWTPEYTDFNFWKQPIQEFPLPDLMPPSPALSARSDTSNQSTLARLRNFSLVGSRHSLNMKQLSLPPPATEYSEAERSNGLRHKNSHLRQMSSFERLSNTLAQFAQPLSTTPNGSRSRSPASRSSSSSTYLDSGSEDEYDNEGDLESSSSERRKKRQRRRSMESMPGSLPGSTDDYQYGVDEEDASEPEYDYQEGSEERVYEAEAAEDAFDEDFLAAGEMKNVPFL